MYVRCSSYAFASTGLLDFRGVGTMRIMMLPAPRLSLIPGVRLPRPPRSPGWRALLAAERAARAAVRAFDKVAEKETERLDRLADNAQRTAPVKRARRAA